MGRRQSRPDGDEHGPHRRIGLMRGAEPKLVSRIEQEAFAITRGVDERWFSLLVIDYGYESKNLVSKSGSKHERAIRRR